jgi:hypothetical protein
MKLVVADTGPLRYLIVLEVVQVLPTPFPGSFFRRRSWVN